MKDAKQYLAAGLLAYASYLVAKCPCVRIISCHKTEFFLSVGAGVGLVVHDLSR